MDTTEYGGEAAISGTAAQAANQKPAGQDSAGGTATAEALDGLIFEIEKSKRYHQRRRGFYEGVHRFILLVVILAGSGSYLAVPRFAEYLPIIAVTFAAIDLVWGVSSRARDHEFLFRKFSDLMALIHRGENCALTVGQISARIEQIESDEPPIMWALEASCYNETTRRLGREISQETGKKQIVDIGWLPRVFMHFLPFAGREFAIKN